MRPHLKMMKKALQESSHVTDENITEEYPEKEGLSIYSFRPSGREGQRFATTRPRVQCFVLARYFASENGILDPMETCEQFWYKHI